MGETADQSKTQPLPAGSFFALPPSMAHHAIADEEDTVIQLNSMDAWSLTYVDANDDPWQKVMRTTLPPAVKFCSPMRRRGAWWPPGPWPRRRKIPLSERAHGRAQAIRGLRAPPLRIVGRPRRGRLPSAPTVGNTGPCGIPLMRSQRVRAWPALVIAPRRCVSPELYSQGTRPR